MSVNDSAAVNARSYYDRAKSSRAKASKTEEAAAQAIKTERKCVHCAIASRRRPRLTRAVPFDTSRKIAQRATSFKAAQKTRTAAVTVIRKPAWFEKFYWFITTDGFVVVAGRDAQQNELLVKRYLRRHVRTLSSPLHRLHARG